MLINTTSGMATETETAIAIETKIIGKIATKDTMSKIATAEIVSKIATAEIASKIAIEIVSKIAIEIAIVTPGMVTTSAIKIIVIVIVIVAGMRGSKIVITRDR